MNEYCLWWKRCICCGSTINMFGHDGVLVDGHEGITYPLCIKHYMYWLSSGGNNGY